MPLLQGGVGDFPGAVKPIFQRSHDVMFVRRDPCPSFRLYRIADPC